MLYYAGLSHYHASLPHGKKQNYGLEISHLSAALENLRKAAKEATRFESRDSFLYKSTPLECDVRVLQDAADALVTAVEKKLGACVKDNE